MVSIWVPSMCRNVVLKSQILWLFGVCVARPQHWLENLEDHRSKEGLERGEGRNGVDLDVQNVPKWGSEIADCRAVWRLCGKAAALAKEL